AGGTVAEGRQHGSVSAWIVVADESVELQALRIADGMKRLCANDDLAKCVAVFVRIPTAHMRSAERAEEFFGTDSSAPANAVFAITREDPVLLGKRSPCTDLRGLLPEERRP